jgi:hypothetical protein
MPLCWLASPLFRPLDGFLTRSNWTTRPELRDFLESDEAAGLVGSAGANGQADAVEDLGYQLLTFWAPRKIAIDGDGLALLPDVLGAWIRFVGRRGGIPEESVMAAVRAGDEYASEMLELGQEPGVWGPAKTMALAI